MSERDKGTIVEKMASLPPDMQNYVEGFVAGMAATANRGAQPAEPGKEKEDARKDG